jgi:hypothetical protein
MIWTVDAIATLRDGWRKGLDAPELARLLGTSRAAVRSKRMRLGLPSRSDAVIALSNRERGLAVSSHSQAPPRGIANVLRMAPLSGSTPRPWAQRMLRECAFPVAGFGVGTLSCCLPVRKPGGAYCDGHVAILRGEPWPPVEPEDLQRTEFDW